MDKQEPVAWAHIENNEIIEFETGKEECEKCEYCVPLYAAPPKREWVGLTDKEWYMIWRHSTNLKNAIEEKLKEKNYK